MSDASTFGYGQMSPYDTSSEFAVTSFIVRQMIAKLDTVKLVQVVAVHGGGLNPAGTVDVFPLVCQVDGGFTGKPHGTVYGLPWSRVQGGQNAVVCDPQVNDVGYVVCADRDISKVSAQNGQLTSSQAGATILPGDIVASAAPGVPYGLPVARVIATSTSADSLFQQATLSFPYDINNIETVFIVKK